jgi:hypothetical protein
MPDHQKALVGTARHAFAHPTRKGCNAPRFERLNFPPRCSMKLFNRSVHLREKRE